MIPVLVVMCGLSFAGKSTLARRLVGELDAELLSLDAINAERGLDGGQGIPAEEWAETHRLAHARAASALRAGRSVVVDDTGSPRFVRDGWRETAAGASAGFGIVWVRIDPARQRERIRRNRADLRRPDVTDDVLASHAADFSEPLDENPIVVDAGDTDDPQQARSIAARLRHLNHRAR